MSELVVREARCVCGDLRVRMKGEPMRMVHTRHEHPYVRPPDGIPLYEDAPE